MRAEGPPSGGNTSADDLSGASNDVAGRAICLECIGDLSLRRSVQGEATRIRCHYCESRRKGITIGATDELGYNVVEDKVHVHDLHATILHLMGLEHTKLTYRFQGRDFRLTDVAGTIVEKLLA